ncbi:hypothetical protein GGTG_05013 [Gaeumannomyces tritici R3-111a-1]|uniref:Uncharacterized protein n=1 Tax=Gaeumannomyces tritici (strain R3-111a-1) TaxID=644352 RepID=J3NUQ7_GAET3|nr:hypothetical protein GGTG_05013 [Gaeumannomyces tritici R3-111a-1]EJT79931.1 hypothetical protein GGTG_05013 [Gaeumannomyces tritici R3-111a-1]
MSTINIVKYYFYKAIVPAKPELVSQYVALAYQTAKDRHIYPKAILIRSHLHRSTYVKGQRVSDPNGLHLTVSFKDENGVTTETHVSSHGYVKDKTDTVINKAVHTNPKADTTPRGTPKPGQARKVVWPDDSELFQEP